MTRRAEFRRVMRAIERTPWLYEGTLTFWSIHRELGKHAASVTGTVLDVGCGCRPYAHMFLSARRYIGLDLARRAGAPDVRGSCAALPFRDRQFECVLLLEVLEHMPETGAALDEIARVVKTGGCLMMSVPQTARIHGAPDDYYRFTRYGLDYLLRARGFRVEYLRERGGFFMSWFQEIAFFLAGEGEGRWLKCMAHAAAAAAQLIGLALDRAVYRPEHTLGYFVVARKAP